MSSLRIALGTGERGRMRGRGFTLIELMIMITILAITMVVLMTVMYAGMRSRNSTTNRLDATQSARTALDMIARDLRSAGYGADLDYTPLPQPAIAYVDSFQVLINANLSPFPDAVPYGAPLAYAPTGIPKPFPLNATTWEPPIRYRTAAEVVRWTLDVNNDGAVNATDVSSPQGQDAARTPNPNDFVLGRQVFGDSTALASGNNGGSTERIALVRGPGAGVAPLFTVYMRGIATPWDWSQGPVPAAELAKIERIQVNVVATSPRPDSRGQFAETKLTTDVKSFRSIPDFGEPLYGVDGFVFDDNVTPDGNRDAGEPGLANVQVRLGNTYAAYTSTTGYYLFQVPAGTYTLRHTPPQGYGVRTDPDSFVVTVPPAGSRDFADSARAGGMVAVLAYRDDNGDAVRDAGEVGLRGVRFIMTPGSYSAYTDTAGTTSFFAGVGGYSVACVTPDSFLVTTPNPQTGTMVNGGSASHSFGLTPTTTGTVEGRVYRDVNFNGMRDVGEPGIGGVWVGVTPDAGTTILGYAYTDSSGLYTATVPANVPPSTTPYYVYTIIPSGYYPTSAYALGPLWVSGGSNLTGYNFGMNAFSVITLTASRVLSLSNTELIEKDWNGSDTQYDTKGHGDADLVLGADAGGTDNISVWFNNYNASPLFAATPADPNGYTRNAPQSVLSMALGTLDNLDPVLRPDLVTGTKNALAGNFFVWYCQNTGGNLGYFPTTYSTGQAYRTSDAGDATQVLLYDCAGGAGKEIIVGTKSPIAGRGTFEVWQHNDAASPTLPSFTRQEIYPPMGAVPTGSIGEVTAMQLADLDGDGDKDLIVGTRTGSYSGELLFFTNVGRINGARFVYQDSKALNQDAITALTVFDMDGDGDLDVVAGTQWQFSRGHLQFWRNETPALLDFKLAREIDADGIVTALDHADMGGAARPDIIEGFRADEVSYVGGMRIYFTDLGTIPASGTDPAGGLVNYFVPALTVGDLNYGVQPSTPPGPALLDFAAGVKTSALTGALLVFIR